MTCFLAWTAVLFLFPVVLLLWATESRQQRALRWRRKGLTYKAIAQRLQCSTTTARRYCLST